MKALEIIHMGSYGSIQDAGRMGYRSFAIPQSGCLDPNFLHLANFLAGNEDDAPVLELIGGKFGFKCLAPIALGIVGIQQTIMLNGQMIDSCGTIHLKISDEIIVETQLSCLSVSGKLEAIKHFASYSSYPLAGLGAGLLKKGAIIDVIPGPSTPRAIKKEILPHLSTTNVIRIVQGPEWNKEIKSTEFEEMQWEVSKNSNRIGIRLSGPELKVAHGEMQSVPTFVGTIQLPPNGQPIVLMNDAQTTGGYQRIAQVIKADLPRIARLMMGGTIRFKFVTIEEAKYIFQHQQAFIRHELQSF